MDGNTSVTATVLDTGNNPIEGMRVSFESNQPNRATVAPTATTNSAGEATAAVTGAGNQVGGVVIEASIDASDGNVEVSDDQTVDLTVTSGVAATLELSQKPGNSTAGSAITPAPSVIVRDSDGNIVTGVDVTATLSTNDFTVASEETVTSDTTSFATFDNLIVEAAANGYTITFGTDAAGVADVTSNSFDVTTATSSAIEFVDGDGQTGEVNTLLANPFVVRVVDDFGNAIAGEDVTFEITTVPTNATGQSLTTITAVSDPAGFAESTLTLGDTAGTYTVEASFNGVTVTFTANATDPI